MRAWAKWIAGVMLVQSTLACKTSVDPRETHTQIGAVKFRLSTPAAGVHIDTIHYRITRASYTKSGGIPLGGDGTTFVATIDGIPSNHGYALALEALESESGARCNGAASFDIAANTQTDVLVALRCPGFPTKTGDVLVHGDIDVCAVIDSISVLPSLNRSTFHLEASARDDDHGPGSVRFQWLASAGILHEPSGAETSLQCGGHQGSVTVTLTVDDGACGDTLSTTVDCGQSSSPDGSALIARDLGSGRCFSVNGVGQVLGLDVDESTFVIDVDGSRNVIATPGSAGAEAFYYGSTIDDAGRVGGFALSDDGRRAVMYQGGAWENTALGDTIGEVIATAADGSRIAGVVYDESAVPRGFWGAAGRVMMLDLPGGSVVNAISAQGRYAGILETSDGRSHAFTSDGTDVIDLGTLGGPGSTALGLNSQGDIVGTAEVETNVRHAFLVVHGTTALVDLGVPAGAVSSDARGIDAAGDIAGNSVDADQTTRAWLFRAGKAPVELRALDQSQQPYVSVHAAAISNRGRIVGWGVLAAADGSSVRCLAWDVEN